MQGVLQAKNYVKSSQSTTSTDSLMRYYTQLLQYGITANELVYQHWWIWNNWKTIAPFIVLKEILEFFIYGSQDIKIAHKNKSLGWCDKVQLQNLSTTKDIWKVVDLHHDYHCMVAQY